MHIAVLDPFQQFHDQIGDMLRQSAEMQDMPFLIHDADRLGVEHASLIHQSARHDSVSGQQVIHRIWVQFIQPLVNLVGVFDLCNVFGWCQNLFPVKDGGDLLQGECVLLDGKGTMDCSDAIGAPKCRVCRQGIHVVNLPTNSAISATRSIVAFVISKGGVLFFIAIRKIILKYYIFLRCKLQYIPYFIPQNLEKLFWGCHSFGSPNEWHPKIKLDAPVHEILNRGCNSLALPLRSHPKEDAN